MSERTGAHTSEAAQGLFSRELCTLPATSSHCEERQGPKPSLTPRVSHPGWPQQPPGHRTQKGPEGKTAQQEERSDAATMTWETAGC